MATIVPLCSHRPANGRRGSKEKKTSALNSGLSVVLQICRFAGHLETDEDVIIVRMRNITRAAAHRVRVALIDRNTQAVERPSANAGAKRRTAGWCQHVFHEPLGNYLDPIGDAIAGMDIARRVNNCQGWIPQFAHYLSARECCRQITLLRTYGKKWQARDLKPERSTLSRRRPLKGLRQEWSVIHLVSLTSLSAA